MSAVAYISFPRKPKVFRLSDVTGSEDQRNSYNFGIKDKGGATFDNCFVNPFVYEFYTEPSWSHADDHFDAVLGSHDSETVKKKLKKISQRTTAFYQQGLFGFIHMNLDIGEYVELYKGWTDHVSTHYKSPKTECSISLDSLLSTPLPTRNRHTEPHKITICKESNKRGEYKLQGANSSDYDDVEMYYMRHLVIMQTQGNEHGVAFACMELGYIAEHCRSLCEAEDWYKRALNIWVKLNDDNRASESCLKLAWLLYMQNTEERLSDNDSGDGIEYEVHTIQSPYPIDFESVSVEWFNRALSYALKAGDAYNSSNACAGIANLAANRNDFVEAEDYYNQCLTHCLELDDDGAVCGVYWNLASIADKRGDYDSAIGYYQQQLRVYMKKGEAYYRNMAFVYKDMRELAEKYHKAVDSDEWRKKELFYKNFRF